MKNGILLVVLTITLIIGIQASISLTASLQQDSFIEGEKVTSSSTTFQYEYSTVLAYQDTTGTNAYYERVGIRWDGDSYTSNSFCFRLGHTSGLYTLQMEMYGDGFDGSELLWQSNIYNESDLPAPPGNDWFCFEGPTITLESPTYIQINQPSGGGNYIVIEDHIGAAPEFASWHYHQGWKLYYYQTTGTYVDYWFAIVDPEMTQVYGRVSNQDDSLPIEDTQVYLIQDNTIVDGTTTDSLGYYEFTSILSGNYSVAFYKNGFDTAVYANVVVNSGEQVEQNVELVQPSEVNLYIEKIEVVQSVASDKLVSDKATYVRIFPKVSGIDKVKNMTAVLTAVKDGSVYLLPENSLSLTVKESYSENDEIEAKNSYNFDVGELPAGNFEFIATLVTPPEILESNTIDNTLEKSVDFVTINGPKIIGLPIIYNGVGPDSINSTQADWLVRKTYPYSEYKYEPRTGYLLNSVCDPSLKNCFRETLLNEIVIYLNNYNRNNPGKEADYAIGFVDQSLTDFVGKSIPSTRSMIIEQFRNDYLTTQIFAHELLHQYGLWMNPENYNTTNPKLGTRINKLDGSFDAERGITTFTNFRHKAWPLKNSYGPVNRMTFMGSTVNTIDGPSPFFTSEDYWIDKADYEYIFDKHTQFKMNDSFNKFLLTDVIQVSGIIKDDQSVILNPFHIVNNSSEISPEDLNGNYVVEFFQGATKLSEHIFSLPLSSEDGSKALFNLTLSFPLGTTDISLLHNGSIVSSRSVSTSIPTVSVLYPNGGENLQGTENIQWEANDSDSSTLNYSVYYSGDNGQEWDVLAANISATSVQVDIDTLPGCNDCLIKVEANDGINTASDISDNTFSVGKKTPNVYINESTDEQEFTQDEKIVLQGYGYDFEDGYLEDNQLTWSSDINGVLGQGSLLKINLSLGVHTITLVGEDSDLNNTDSQITIAIIADSDSDGMSDAWETLHGLNINFDDSELDPDQDGRLNFYEYLYDTEAFIWEPYLKSISPKTVSERGTVRIKPELLSNPQNNSVTYEIDSTLFEWDGTYFKWETSPTSSGSYAFTVTATHGALIDSKTIPVTVNNTCKVYNKQTKKWDCEEINIEAHEAETNLY